MKQREIKFRAWHLDDGMLYFDFDSFQKDYHDQYGSIMQYTGLKDKNGKEIYENDWCYAKFRTKEGIRVIQGRIIMDDFMWCIDCTNSIGDDIFIINRPHDFEVIGNIYENPELIK